MQIFKLLTISALVSLSVSAAPVNSDDGGEIYLDSYMEVTTKKKEAAYYCELVEQTEKGFHYKAYFMTGELKMDGWYADSEMEIPQGAFTYYFQNGKVESEGAYLEGSKVGIWQRYAMDGTQKPEKVYASLGIMKAIEDAKKLKEMNE